MLSGLLYRLRALFRHNRVERELDDELQFHLDHEREKYVAEGLAPDEASRQARLALGGLDQVKQECREARGISLLETTNHDFRYAGRMMRRSPGFTAVAVLLLGLGIGVNVAIFSIIDEVLLRMLPVRHPEQLVLLTNTQGGTSRPSFSYPLFLELSKRQQVLSGLCASGDALLREVRMGGSAQGLLHVEGRLVSENYFSVLGVGAVQGRVFSPNESADAVTVISYGFWQREFAGAPSAVGSMLGVNGITVTIIGVAPRGFFGESVGRCPDLWLPVNLQPRLASDNWLENGAVSWLRVLGRRDAEGSNAQAEAVLSAIYQGWADDSPGGTSAIRCRITLESGSKGLQEMREKFSRPLWVLMGAVGLILLIACTNLAGLLLARATGRRHEIGLRLALGATRACVVRQLLVESLLLSFLGGALGIGVAAWGVSLLVALISDPSHPYALVGSLDVRVLAFAAGLAVASSVAFGLVPALQTTVVDLSMTLKGNGRRLGEGLQGRRIARGLVAAQVAVSLVLLVGSALLVRSLWGLYQVDTGFQRQGLLTAHVPMGAALRLNRISMQRDLLNRLTSIPGVLGVGLGTFAPIVGGIQTRDISIQGRPERISIGMNLVSAGYFATAGMNLRQGRDFNPADTTAAQKVAVVNLTMSRRCFGDQSPVGRLISFGPAFDARQAVQIVGLVDDARYNGLREPSQPLAFVSLAQQRAPIFSIIIRTAADPDGFLAPIREALRQVDSDLATAELTTLDQTVESTLVEERLLTKLCAAFGLLALTLTCVGLYGTVSYGVTRRIPEIGMRMALGASRSDMLWLVLKEAGLLVLTGLTLGAPAALAASSLLRNLVFGLATTDPSSYVVAAAVVSLVCLAAGYLPALKASRVDPAMALRNE